MKCTSVHIFLPLIITIGLSATLTAQNPIPRCPPEAQGDGIPPKPQSTTPPKVRTPSQTATQKEIRVKPQTTPPPKMINGTKKINTTLIQTDAQNITPQPIFKSTKKVGDINPMLRHYNHKVLTEKEEDQIYISFMDEKRRKKAEAEKRKKEEERKKKEAKLAQLAALKAKQCIEQGGAEVYPHDLNNPLQIIGKRNMPKKRNNLNRMVKKQPKKKKIEEDSKFTVTGISCTKGRCVAFTNEGMKRKGDKLKGGETIKRITANLVKTDVRSINF